MDTSTYTALTGIAVNASNSARITAAIRKTQAILEELLGYSLDDQSATDERIFPRVRHDQNKKIDPATAISAVRLIKNGATIHTYTTDEYTVMTKFGLVTHIRIHKCPICFYPICICTDPLYELGVTGTWAFASDAFPDSLLGIWSEMITFYADPNYKIKSETLGSHSYTKSDNDAPELDESNRVLLQRYAGPRGTLGTLPL